MAGPIMNTELVLEAPRRVADGGGGYETHWAPLGTLWAEVRASSARERLVGGRESSQVRHRITVRWAPEGSPRRPTAECRFRQGARVFHIRGVAGSDPSGRYLTCWADEGVLS